jgi:hypothetical protein
MAKCLSIFISMHGACYGCIIFKHQRISLKVEKQGEPKHHYSHFIVTLWEE